MCSKVKIYVGLSFNPQNSDVRRMQSFRRRYDPKYLNSQILSLPLMPALELSSSEEEHFKELVTDEAENFFYGQDAQEEIALPGLSFERWKREHLLYLRPELSSSVTHFSEALSDLSKQMHLGVSKAKVRPPFLLLGRFNRSEDLKGRLLLAQKELSPPFSLPISRLCLFKKRCEVWTHWCNLFNFYEETRAFEELAV